MSAERHTRRSFLRGRAAADELVELAARPSADDIGSDSDTTRAAVSTPPAAREHGALLVSVRRRAMACEWEVQLAAARDDDSMERIFEALDLVESLEDQLTVYRNDSEVQRINREAAVRPLAVEPRLFELFRLAKKLHDDTRGALDITSGPLSEIWGFSRRRGRVPEPADIEAALQRLGMSDVILDEASQAIAFRRLGISVNFNSIGKGYALDRMAEHLADGGVNDYLLHGGKSSVLARGNHPGQRRGSGWNIGLRNPLRPAERLAEFCLRDESLSTSGSGTQFFRRRGRRYGHILDPRTGQPVDGIFSATVIAPTAAEADALSTAFYVLGPQATADYCATRPEISALLVCPASREGEVQLCSYGLDNSRWQPLSDR